MRGKGVGRLVARFVRRSLRIDSFLSVGKQVGVASICMCVCVFFLYSHMCMHVCVCVRGMLTHTETRIHVVVSSHTPL